MKYIYKVFSYIFLFFPEHPFALRESRNGIERMNTKGFCGVSIYPQLNVFSVFNVSIYPLAK